MMTTKNYRWYWLALGLLFLTFLYLVKAILLPFVVGILFAYLLDPAADWLERRKCSRGSATAIITLWFFTLVVLAVVTLAPLLYKQFMELLTALPGYLGFLEQRYMPKVHHFLSLLDRNGIVEQTDTMQSLSAHTTELVGKFFTGLLHSGAAALNIISLLLITPVVTFYLLRDWDNLIARVRTLLPPRHTETIVLLARQIDHTLAGFIRGQLNACLILGVFYAIALTAAGLHFGVIIGMLAGLMILLPYVGTIVSGMVSVGVAYAQFDDINRTLIVLVIFVAGQMLEGNYVTPKLVGDRVGLHPVWLIFGMLAGGALFGFVGVLIAVPVTAVIGVFVRFTVGEYEKSALYRQS